MDKVFIDGVEYVPKVVKTRTDCDGRPVAIGDRVKVRMSALNTQDNRDMGFDAHNRYGTVLTYHGGTHTFGIKFDHHFNGMHTLNGATKIGYGFWEKPEWIRRV